MDDDAQAILVDFAKQLGIDESVVEERWEGRPDHIMEDIFQVRDMDTGEVRDLELFDTQRKAVMAYFYGDADTISNYKGRRIGYSFIYCACFLLEGVFIPNSFYPVVSRKFEQACNRIEDIKMLVENAKVEIPAPKSNRDEIELWNGSGYKAYSGDPDASRGDKSARAVLLDEKAFIENQPKVTRAFGAFLSLGKNRKMVEVSTPNVKNDQFMQTFNRGTATGYDDEGKRVGVISIKQPSFWNADDIDINTPLYEQELHPARPDMNISRVEEERAADPAGFGQEYLCRPILDEYRFLSETAIAESMEASEATDIGIDVPKPAGAFRAIGVDIGISSDDTVIQVFDHIGSKRVHRYMEIVTDDTLREFGYDRPDRGNAEQVASLIASTFRLMNGDLVVLDRTGPGETFDRLLTDKLGRAVLGFNFSDKRTFEEMMGDFNSTMRNGRMTLIPDDRFRDELESIVKIKKEDWSVPSFSGKDNSESGKDDTAMAAVLAAFPPGYAVKPSTATGQRAPEEPPRSELGAPQASDRQRRRDEDRQAPAQKAASYGSASLNTSTGGYGSRRSYAARHPR